MYYLLEMTYEQLREVFTAKGFPAFRADQLHDWIFQKKVFESKKMTNLPDSVKAFFEAELILDLPEVVDHQVSKIDRTEKFLFGLNDGITIESVLLYHKDRITACLSTQAGCALKCDFCATGKGGFQRNLSCHEIVGQAIVMEQYSKKSIGNIVFMGMGEPLLNYENVKRSLQVFMHPKQFGISKRRITISTAGIVPGIERLAEDALGITLSISLHAANNALRDQLMPINRKYPLEELVYTLQKYIDSTTDRVTIEYILIAGINDSDAHAQELCFLLKGKKININLIPVNSTDTVAKAADTTGKLWPMLVEYKKPKEDRIDRFLSILEKEGFETVVRIEKGADIEAACGQLKNKGERK